MACTKSCPGWIARTFEEYHYYCCYHHHHRYYYHPHHHHPHHHHHHHHHHYFHHHYYHHIIIIIVVVVAVCCSCYQYNYHYWNVIVIIMIFLDILLYNSFYTNINSPFVWTLWSVKIGLWFHRVNRYFINVFWYRASEHLRRPVKLSNRIISYIVS